MINKTPCQYRNYKQKTWHRSVVFQEGDTWFLKRSCAQVFRLKSFDTMEEAMSCLYEEFNGVTGRDKVNCQRCAKDGLIYA